MERSDELTFLRARVDELESQLELLRTHKTFARGLSGERLIARFVGGRMTVHDAGHDVVTSSDIRLEVKASKAAGGRWQWNSIFGEPGAKDFDFLILVGEALNAFREQYKDPGSPYVTFAMPYDEVASFTQGGGRPGKVMIKLGINPDTLRNPASRRLFEDYQVTMDEINERFGLRPTR